MVRSWANPDESLRGVSVFRTSVEDARRLAEKDPSVLAGRIELEVFTRLMQPGALGDRPAKLSMRTEAGPIIRP